MAIVSNISIEEHTRIIQWDTCTRVVASQAALVIQFGAALAEPTWSVDLGMATHQAALTDHDLWEPPI